MRPGVRLAAATALAVLALGVAGGSWGAHGGHAQDLEAQAVAIERQLLCPQCTSKRLDVCDLPICDDMRRLIRERLAAGDDPDSIVRFFSNRYGQRVLAELPKSGFNLFLFGWVGGSLLLVAVAGGAVLLRLRRSATPAAAALDDDDERWLDAQLEPPGDDD